MKMLKYALGLMILIGCSRAALSQNTELIAEAREYQEKLDSEYADPKESPLEKKDLKVFKGLDFFEIDPDYIVKADFVRTPSESPFTMKTSTDRLPVYVKYGELYFTLKGENFKLNVYQNQELVQDPEYFDYLFLPFTDLTKGDITYGGGRYIDLLLPLSKKVTLDFNKAYNPYCAYSKEYSCALPTKEDYIDIALHAGEKKFHD